MLPLPQLKIYTFLFSGEAHQARQADPLQALGRDHHHRHHQATPDRALPQVQLQDLQVLDPQAGVSEGRQPQGKSTSEIMHRKSNIV